jgi:hypothetical protein
MTHLRPPKKDDCILLPGRCQNFSDVSSGFEEALFFIVLPHPGSYPDPGREPMRMIDVSIDGDTT